MATILIGRENPVTLHRLTLDQQAVIQDKQVSRPT